MCGIFGITNAADAAVLAAIAAHALQHRGQEGAGIAVTDCVHMRAHRAVGLVSDTFTDEALIASLKGTAALSHVRYSTSGAKHGDPEMAKRAAQPFVTRGRFGEFAVVHNGNATNADTLRAALIADGYTFESDSDTEVIAKLIAQARGKSFRDCVKLALFRVEGAYSLLIMSNDEMIAVRDRYGTRPLVMGNRNGSYVFASETAALTAVKAVYQRDVEAGQMIVVKGQTAYSENLFKPHLQPCAFEWIYFMRPDHVLAWNESVYQVRERVGQMLARTHAQEADLVVPVLDSGLPFGLGYAQEAGIPFAPALVRNHYAIGRSFIEPTQKGRDAKVRNKHAVIAPLVRNKRIVLVDDSAVRGTTSRLVVELLFEAGAREVHLVLAYPPFRRGCPSGTDVPNRKELFAADIQDDRMVERRLCELTRATSARFPTPQEVLSCVNSHGGLLREQVCMGCVDGVYPFMLTDRKYKDL